MCAMNIDSPAEEHALMNTIIKERDEELSRSTGQATQDLWGYSGNAEDGARAKVALGIGDEWYVQTGSSVALEHVQVVHVTERTINLRIVGPDAKYARYLRRDIEFVERA